MSQNFIFHPRESHIQSRFDISMLCMIFRGFEKYWVSAKNPKRLAFNFTEKRLLTTKTSWKSIFIGREDHLLPESDVKVLYIIFLGFKKYRVLAQNPKRPTFYFSNKHLFTAKIVQKFIFHPNEAHMLSLFRCFSVLHKFLVVLKNIKL
jgi:hypothetical protein